MPMLRRWSALFFCTLCLMLACGYGLAQDYAPVDISGFLDGIGHWQRAYGRDREDARYEPDQIVEIADNLLRHQRDDGGWPKDIDWLAIVDPSVVRELKGDSYERSTFDNRNTYTQVDYLAKVFAQTGQERFRDAARRGLDYILAEQRPSGGWRGWDVDAITYNDDVMTGVMELLLDIRRGAPHFAWLDDTRRDRLSRALDRAVAVTLACQIEIDGKNTGWCQQHDHETLMPVKARTYELPSIGGSETVSVVYFLMSIPDPTPEIVTAVDAAVAWLDSARIEGIRLERFDIPPQRFKGYTATQDLRVVEDPDAPSLWARFYELDTGRPFFCNRDGRKIYSLAEVDLERRVGYAWYGAWATRLLEKDYPAWKRSVSSEE